MSAVGLSAVGVEAVAGSDSGSGTPASVGVFVIEGASTPDFVGGSLANLTFSAVATSSVVFRSKEPGFSITGTASFTPIMAGSAKMTFISAGKTSSSLRVLRARSGVFTAGGGSLFSAIGKSEVQSGFVFGGKSALQFYGQGQRAGTFSVPGQATAVFDGLSCRQGGVSIKGGSAATFRMTYSFTSGVVEPPSDYAVVSLVKQRGIYVIT